MMCGIWPQIQLQNKWLRSITQVLMETVFGVCSIYLLHGQSVHNMCMKVWLDTHVQKFHFWLLELRLFTRGKKTRTLYLPLWPTGDQRDIDMTQIIGPKSCLHNLINLQFPHNRRPSAVPRSVSLSPPTPTLSHADTSLLATARCSAFLPFSPQITAKPAWCLLPGHKRALAPVIS